MPDGGDVDGGRVVVVDDEERVADVYASFLADKYETETAYGGEAALDVIDDAVDVVLLDRRMPEMHGDEVLERLRDDGYEGRVVLVTALDPGFDIVDMRFEQYVCKPVGRDELRTIVHQEILRANYDDALQEYLRLQSKVSAIEDEHPSPAVANDDRARTLRDRLEELRDGLLDTLVEHAQLEYDGGERVEGGERVDGSELVEGGERVEGSERTDGGERTPGGDVDGENEDTKPL